MRPSSAKPRRNCSSAAKRLETLDDELARETYLEALAAAMYAGRLGEPGALAECRRGRPRCGRPGAGTAAADRLPVERHGESDHRWSGSAGSDRMRTALELMALTRSRTMAKPALDVAGLRRSRRNPPRANCGTTRSCSRLATDMVRRARDAGALAVLPPALAYRAGVHVLAGEFATAATLLEEANSITAATGYTPVRYHSLSLAAWRGIPADAVGLIEAAAADGAARGEGRVLGVIGYAHRRPLQRSRPIRGGIRRRPRGV